MSHLTWSATALRDLARVVDFLASKNEAASLRAAGLIFQAVHFVAQHPEAGRHTLDLTPDYREWVVKFGKGAYVIFYQHSHSGVTILALRHNRELGYTVEI